LSSDVEIPVDLSTAEHNFFDSGAVCNLFSLRNDILEEVRALSEFGEFLDIRAGLEKKETTEISFNRE